MHKLKNEWSNRIGLDTLAILTLVGIAFVLWTNFH